MPCLTQLDTTTEFEPMTSRTVMASRYTTCELDTEPNLDFFLYIYIIARYLTQKQCGQRTENL